MDQRELVRRMADGERFAFFPFYGHAPRADGRVDASCLSQWYAAPFEVGCVRYATAEHFMMAEKARLFRDEDALAAVLACDAPREAKACGRAVEGYDDAAWGAARVDAVVRGNLAKFGQHDALRAFLLGTGERVLVEASPRDTIWGVGLGARHPSIPDPARWRGRNLLGFALMAVRDTLRA